MFQPTSRHFTLTPTGVSKCLQQNPLLQNLATIPEIRSHSTTLTDPTNEWTQWLVLKVPNPDKKDAVDDESDVKKTVREVKNTVGPDRFFECLFELASEAFEKRIFENWNGKVILSMKFMGDSKYHWLEAKMSKVECCNKSKHKQADRNHQRRFVGGIQSANVLSSFPSLGSQIHVWFVWR